MDLRKANCYLKGDKSGVQGCGAVLKFQAPAPTSGSFSLWLQNNLVQKIEKNIVSFVKTRLPHQLSPVKPEPKFQAPAPAIQNCLGSGSTALVEMFFLAYICSLWPPVGIFGSAKQTSPCPAISSRCTWQSDAATGWRTADWGTRTGPAHQQASRRRGPRTSCEEMTKKKRKRKISNAKNISCTHEHKK